MLYWPVWQRVVKRFLSTSLPCPSRPGNAHFATMHGDNASSTRWSIYSHYTIKCMPNNWRQSKREKLWKSRHDSATLVSCLLIHSLSSLIQVTVHEERTL